MQPCLTKCYFDLDKLEKTLNMDNQRSLMDNIKNNLNEIIILRVELKRIIDNLNES